MLRVATIVDDTEAEGPGRRFALWVQGCAIRCPGCCNPEMFAHDRGTPMTVDDVLARLARARGVEGVTFLGGEPFAQAAGEAAGGVAAGRVVRPPCFPYFELVDKEES